MARRAGVLALLLTVVGPLVTADAWTVGTGEAFPLAAQESDGPALPVQAGEVATRVGSAEGPVRFRVAVRDGVEVCGDGVVVDGERRRGRWEGATGPCSRDTAEVVMRVREGRVVELDLEPWEGEGPAMAGTDLGLVGAEAAAGFLTGLALGRGPGADRRAAEHGLMASVLLKDVEVWPALLDVARDRGVDGRLRRSALFWTSRVAARRVTAEVRELAADDSEEQDVRDAAVFALSQRPAGEAIPALIELARSAPQPKTRKSALFWLAQRDDPRVLDFFREILRGG